MKRTNRISYRSAVITPDLADALRKLEQGAVALGNMSLRFAGPSPNLNWAGFGKQPGPTGYPPWLSMLPAGREVSLRMEYKTWEGGEREGGEREGDERDRRQAELNTLWGLAVPLGFVPWLRYPVPGEGDEVFHYLGPWRRLYDHLCGEGRGELAWPSVVCAAQVDVNTWEGDKRIERFVQAQLHRLGAHCGPVDGIVGERTLGAIRALGVHGLPLIDLAEYLRKLTFSPPDKADRRVGHVILPGWDVVASSYGAIHTTHIPQGVALTVDGPGRVVLDVNHPEGES